MGLPPLSRQGASKDTIRSAPVGCERRMSSWSAAENPPARNRDQDRNRNRPSNCGQPACVEFEVSASPIPTATPIPTPKPEGLRITRLHGAAQMDILLTIALASRAPASLVFTRFG